MALHDLPAAPGASQQRADPALQANKTAHHLPSRCLDRAYFLANSVSPASEGVWGDVRPRDVTVYRQYVVLASVKEEYILVEVFVTS